MIACCKFRTIRKNLQGAAINLTTYVWEVKRVNAFKAFDWLMDKKHGFGMPANVLARYCGCHPSTIRYHKDLGGPITPEAQQKYNEALMEMIEDFKKNVINVD